MDRRSLLRIAALGFATGALGGCARPEVANEPAVQQVTAPSTRPSVDEDQIRSYIHETNGFGLDLFRTMVEESPESNLLISPISVSGALAMTWAGARGETESQMQEVLRFPHDQQNLHPTVGAFQFDLDEVNEVETDEEKEVELSVANALWGEESFEFRNQYLSVVEENYGAGFREVDFRNEAEESRRTINEWVSEATNGQIEELFGANELDHRTRLVLTNAVYLLADWKHQFDPDQTADGEFHNLDGSTSSIPMMRQTETVSAFWSHEEGYRVVELPYAGNRLSMVVVLPDEGAFETFEAGLDAEWIQERFAELDEMSDVEYRVVMPRFEAGLDTKLSAHLKTLGMGLAFSWSAANFDGMTEKTERDLYLDDVYHDTFISVDEEGTEAAAATGSEMNYLSGPSEIRMDRPFLYAIRDRETDAMLFLGRVVDGEALDDPADSG